MFLTGMEYRNQTDALLKSRICSGRKKAFDTFDMYESLFLFCNLLFKRYGSKNRKCS